MPIFTTTILGLALAVAQPGGQPGRDACAALIQMQDETIRLAKLLQSVEDDNRQEAEAARRRGDGAREAVARANAARHHDQIENLLADLPVRERQDPAWIACAEAEVKP